MQFYFIRHAQSVNNALYDSTGSSQGRSWDPELTQTGVRQAQILGDFLKNFHPDPKVSGRDPMNLAGFGITHLYCSLMLRAIQTASIASESLGLPLMAWVDIHEEGGIYKEDATTGVRTGLPGVTRAYLQQNYPRVVLPKAVGENGWWNKPFEDQPQRLARAQRFYQELLEKHGGTEDRVAIVSHGGFYNLLMHVLLNSALDGRLWFVMNNAAITRVDFEEGMAAVYSNRTDFLPAELIT